MDGEREHENFGTQRLSQVGRLNHPMDSTHGLTLWAWTCGLGPVGLIIWSISFIDVPTGH